MLEVKALLRNIVLDHAKDILPDVWIGPSRVDKGLLGCKLGVSLQKPRLVESDRTGVESQSAKGWTVTSQSIGHYRNETKLRDVFRPRRSSCQNQRGHTEQLPVANGKRAMDGYMTLQKEQHLPIACPRSLRFVQGVRGAVFPKFIGNRKKRNLSMHIHIHSSDNIATWEPGVGDGPDRNHAIHVGSSSSDMRPSKAHSTFMRTGAPGGGGTVCSSCLNGDHFTWGA